MARLTLLSAGGLFTSSRVLSCAFYVFTTVDGMDESHVAVTREPKGTYLRLT